ncbi:MAG: tyrosine-type recombinase/integrase [Lentisphaerota bacterium]
MAGKSIKLETGTVYKKTANGVYIFRYQINGRRKAVSLKTKNQDEAVLEAKKLVPVVNGTTLEVISAHVKHARGLTSARKSLPLNLAWDKYSKHPDRAVPATVSEQDAYKGTFNDFVGFVGNDTIEIMDINQAHADEFAKHMRTLELGVDTHNRKIRRLRKIFDVLKEYREGPNPFATKSLFRKEREEQAHNIRRLSFTRDQEQALLKALDNNKYKVMNKPEIRVVYYLGMFTGQRFKDCIMLRWDKIDLNRKRIWVKQFKTGKEVTIPMAPELLDVLHEAQRWRKNDYVCPNVAARYNQENKAGKNTGNNLVNIDALRVIKWIGLEPSVKVPGRKKKVTVYGFHSLRHSFASHCAEAGVPKAVVTSILGTNSEIVDKYYTHVGEDAQEKAIQAISRKTNTTSVEERLSKVLTVIDSLKAKSKAILQIEKILREN